MSNFKTGTLLRKLRNEYGYTIQEVSNLLGVSKAAVSKWENGDDIKTENLYSLSRLYRVTFKELYEGRLKDEPSSLYWERNYELGNYKIDVETINKNIDVVKELFESIRIVKETFFDNLKKWASDHLEGSKLEEFNYIKKYFDFDKDYYTFKRLGPGYVSFTPSESEIKKFVLEAICSVSTQDVKSRRWEISKLFNFNFDFKEEVLLESKNNKALEYMLGSFNQIEKDLMLYANIHIKEIKETDRGNGLVIDFGPQEIYRNRTPKEIQRLSFIKVILDSGAKWLIEPDNSVEGWDKEHLNFMDGKKTYVDTAVYSKYRFHDYYGHGINPLLKYWKCFSYKQYLELVDNNKTEFLNDIFNLRESNPLEYFNRFVTRNFS